MALSILSGLRWAKVAWHYSATTFLPSGCCCCYAPHPLAELGCVQVPKIHTPGLPLLRWCTYILVYLCTRRGREATRQGFNGILFTGFVLRLGKHSALRLLRLLQLLRRRRRRRSFSFQLLCLPLALLVCGRRVFSLRSDTSLSRARASAHLQPFLYGPSSVFSSLEGVTSH